MILIWTRRTMPQKTLWEKEKMLVTSIFSFSAMFSTLINREIMILAMFNLSSADAFNLVTFKILSFGKGVKQTFDSTWIMLKECSVKLNQVNTLYKSQLLYNCFSLCPPSIDLGHIVFGRPFVCLFVR